MRRVLAACSIVGVGALVLVSPAEVHPAAQVATPEVTAETPTPTPPFESSLIGRVDLDALPEGPAAITATSVTLAPGTVSQPFTSSGPTLIIVEDGSVTLDADAAAVGVPNVSSMIGIQPANETPVASAVEVPEDWQVLLPAGATAQLRNNTNEPVSLILLSIVPQR